jgi:hypothetical protein
MYCLVAASVTFSAPSSYLIFSICGNVEKNNLGLRICKLYVEKKIFISLDFPLQFTVLRFVGFFPFHRKKIVCLPTNTY